MEVIKEEGKEESSETESKMKGHFQPHKSVENVFGSFETDYPDEIIKHGTSKIPKCYEISPKELFYQVKWRPRKENYQPKPSY